MPLDWVPPFQFENQTIKVQNRNKGGYAEPINFFSVYKTKAKVKWKAGHKLLRTFVFFHIQIDRGINGKHRPSAYLVNLLMKNTKVFLSNSWKQLFLSRHGETKLTGAQSRIGRKHVWT